MGGSKDNKIIASRKNLLSEITNNKIKLKKTKINNPINNKLKIVSSKDNKIIANRKNLLSEITNNKIKLKQTKINEQNEQINFKKFNKEEEKGLISELKLIRKRYYELNKNEL